jgi:UDP-galactopyranose mutase
LEKSQQVGIIGAGSFGTAIAQLISENANVLLFARNRSLVEKINASHKHHGIQLNKNIIATSDPEFLDFSSSTFGKFSSYDEKFLTLLASVSYTDTWYKRI